jgi:preprotein translocase subunit SecD
MKITRFIALGVIILFGAGIWFGLTSTTEQPFRGFRLGLDLQGGSYLVYEADTSALTTEDTEGALDALRDVIEARINAFGVAEPLIARETAFLGEENRTERLTIELPGVTDIDEAIRVIGETPVLEFKLARMRDPEELVSLNADAIDETGSLDLDASLFFEYEDTGLTGRFLERSLLQFDPSTRQPIIALDFNAEGRELFAQITRENVGETLAIFLDGNIISAPTVQEEIPDGQAIISGVFTPVEARELVGRLNSGALPVPISLLSVSSIGPTLGAQALSQGIIAGLIGFLAVIVMMILWYRMFGVVAAVSLVCYVVIMLALFRLTGITLTTAGIAGLIISLGMAVDANILIFERVNEELQKGTPLHDAIKEGFDRAWLSIRDGNISSIISALVLFWFGTPLIKGFALVFGLGVIVSMFSAITISRVFMYAVSPSRTSKLSRLLFSSGFRF